MDRIEIILNSTYIGQLNEQGEAKYIYNYVVNAEPGPVLFDMLVDFLHEAPDWVSETFTLALKFNAEHDRINCPHCQAAKANEERLSYDEWKKELIMVTARYTGVSERTIVLRDQQTREWYDSGATPWQCFRENWDADGD